MPRRLAGEEADPVHWGLVRAEQVEIRTAEGITLHGWWVPAEPEGVEPCGSAIHLHGNMGNISSRAGIGRALTERGLNVLLLDYRGYGLSEGVPTEPGLYQDASEAYRYVRQTKSVPSDRLLLVGHSIGSAVATNLAARERVSGLVLVGAFTSIPRSLRAHFFFLPDWIFGSLDWRENVFDTVNDIAKVEAAVLFVRGSEDRFNTRADARALFAAAHEPKIWLEVDGAGHNDVLGRSEFWRSLESFVQTTLDCPR